MTNEPSEGSATRRGFLASVARALIACTAAGGVGWLATRHGIDCEAGSFCPGCPDLANCQRPEAQAVRMLGEGRRP